MQKVSVIVPVYNVEKYVEGCINSLINQDYQNIEIILVNDESTDSSMDKCMSYVSKDSRIRLINTTHGGPGAARNHGIDAAHADLITFVDGDDWVETNYISSLVHQKEHFHSNIAMAMNKEFHESDNTVYLLNSPAPGDHSFDHAYSALSWFKQSYKFQNALKATVWMKLYDKKLFDKVRFPEHGTLFEDALVTWRLIFLADRISFSNDIIYTYRIGRTHSIMTDHSLVNASNVSVRIFEQVISILTAAHINSDFVSQLYQKELNNLLNLAKQQGDFELANLTQNKLAIINRLKTMK